MAADAPDAALAILYPYDGTVFPRGLLPPRLMWRGADSAAAVHLHIKSSLLELHLCAAPSAPGQLQLPADIWAEIEAAARGPSDPFAVELRVWDGSAARGPLRQQLVIAQATLKGSIYYNSYASQLASGAGAVLRIAPGKEVELFAGSSADCTGCHAMSADGSRMISQIGNGTSGHVYALSSGALANPAPQPIEAPTANFVGLAPDGSVFVVGANVDGVGPRSSGATSATATMYETDTGTRVADTGIPDGAVMLTFSPDAKRITFNDHAIARGHGLAVMDYDAATRKASNYRVVYTDPLLYPGWPFFLPDERAVIFAAGTTSDFAGDGVGIGEAGGIATFLPGLGGLLDDKAKGPASNLFLVDAAGGGSPVLLAKAMGYAAPGTSYLPFAAEEQDQSYYPTVSPVAAGGYFWVFFDSMRHYGNRGLQRQLWGTAVTIAPDGKYEEDPSHPAFYLTGQEEGTGNHRAFTALDPCRPRGATCATGIDCCGGFCTDGLCEVPSTTRCAQVDEACQTSAGCCDPSHSCLGGFCSEVRLN